MSISEETSGQELAIQERQWVHALRQYLQPASSPAVLPDASLPEVFSGELDSIQAEATRPEGLSTTLAASTMIHPAQFSATATPIVPVATPVTAVLVKEQFKVGVLDRPLIDAIDLTVLQRSPLAIQAKPQWTVATRQVYRQVPPVPRMDQPVTVGNFLLFPDPIWDAVPIVVSEELFIRQPQTEYVVIDRPKFQHLQLQAVPQSFQAQPLNYIQPRSITLESTRGIASDATTVSLNNQLMAANLLNQATVSHINATAIHQANLTKALPITKGKLQVRRAFFASTQPWMKEFKLIVRQEQRNETIQTTGGTAYLTVSVYAQPDADALSRYRTLWTDALANAGYGIHLWKFIPVNIRNLQASLELPPGCSVDTSVDVEDGTVTFVIQLSSPIAQAWRQALETRQPHLITGICRFQADYFAREDDHLKRDRQQLSAALPTLLKNCSPDVVQILNPNLAIHTAIDVRGSSIVDSVTVNWQPNTKTAPIQQVFGSAGGTLTGIVTTTDLNRVAIDWNAKVKYRMAGWAEITQTGRLSASLLRDIVKPGSSERIQQFTLFSAFMVGREQLAIDPASLRLFEDIDVEATLTLSAASLTVPLITTVTLGNTEMTQIPFPVLPDLARNQMGLAITTKSHASNRILFNLERVLRPIDTLINVKIYTDGRIEILVDTDPIAESSIDAEIFSLLASFDS